MAKFKMELPTELIKEFETLEKKSEKIFGEMTKAGAEVVAKNVQSNAPNTIKNYVKISKVYKTPSDGGINTKVYVSGYIPFSDPNRKYFSRTNGKSSTVYKSTEGVPADFLANLYEYGRSTAPFPKHPFLRKSFKKKEIEDAMLQAQIRASGGLLDE
jgi:HK97 gp10 family phage protein